MEIQTGFRLVQNDELRLIDKGTGDEHHLQFTAAHPVAVLVGKAGDPHPFHHGFRHFNLLFAGLLKGPKMCTAPQQNHFQTSVGKSEAARLRNVGDGTPDILRFEGVNKPFPALSEELQKHLYFEFGSIEDHFKYRQAVIEAYPCGNYPIFEGYDHMQYQIRDPKGFAEMLAFIAEQDGMPKLPFIRK